MHTELINGNVSNEVGGIIQRGEEKRGKERGKEVRHRLAISTECAFVLVHPPPAFTRNKSRDTAWGDYDATDVSSAESGCPLVIKLEALPPSLSMRAC